MSKWSYLHRYTGLAIFLFSLCLSACGKPALQVEYHNLTPQSNPSNTRMETPPEILVGPVRVSSFLNQGPMVKQRSPHSVHLLEQHHWAGDLEEMLSRILIQNLILVLGNEKIYSYPATSAENGMRLAINFFHFEKDTSGKAILEARWKLISNKDQTVLHSSTSKKSTLPENENYDALAEALSLCMVQLCHEIADTVKQVQLTPQSTQENQQ